ncbi:MAG TPA: DinB family protein [Candidatus Acidoferrum sp.]|jgi:uncharacterized damage-inducible protein DinB
MMTQNRPKTGDYATSYEKYIALVPQGEFLQILDTQLREWQRLVGDMSEEQANFRYAQGKWSIKEMLGHVSDTERIFAYRLLRIARGDQTPMAGFEQDDYVRTANSSARKRSDLLEEFTAVRRATMALASSLDDAAWLRRGVANQKEISATALAFVIAGHDRHHQLVLEERYLPALPRG